MQLCVSAQFTSELILPFLLVSLQLRVSSVVKSEHSLFSCLRFIYQNQRASGKSFYTIVCYYSVFSEASLLKCGTRLLDFFPLPTFLTNLLQIELALTLNLNNFEAPFHLV